MDTHLENGSERSNVSLILLDQPALGKIINYLDCKSFHSLLLTCRKLSSFVYFPETWNNNVLCRRGRYLLDHCLFSTKNSKRRKTDAGGIDPLKLNIMDILQKALDCCSFLGSIVPSQITYTWDTWGPVFGKLHSLVLSHKYIDEYGVPRAACGMDHIFITLELPSGKQLQLLYSNFFDGIGEHEEEEAIKAAIGSVPIIYNTQSSGGVLNSQSSYWRGVIQDDGKAPSDDLDCLNSICRILEEEIGEVSPDGINGGLIKEFVKIFPRFYELFGSSQGVKSFKDKESNILDKVSLKAQYLKKRQLVMSNFKKDINLNSSDSEGKHLSQSSEFAAEDNTNTVRPVKQGESCESLKTTKSLAERFQVVGGTSGKQQEDMAIQEFANLVSILTGRRARCQLSNLETALLYA